MRNSNIAGYALSATIAVGLAGCSGGSSATAPFTAVPAQGSTAGQSFLRDAQHPELVPILAASRLGGGVPQLSGSKPFAGTIWLSDAGTNALYKCSYKKCTSVGSGLSEPQGIAADAKGNVYVADTANARIVVFSKAGKQIDVLSEPGEYPVDVAVAPDGTVGVTNIISTTGGNGDIVFYAGGATSPTSTATGLLADFYYGSFDKAGNFYNDGEDSSGGIHVGVVAKGSSTDVDTGITGIGFPGDVLVGSKDNILNVGDQVAGDIEQYSLPKLKNIGTVDVPGAYFAFPKGDKDIWASASDITEYTYPAGAVVYTSDIPSGGAFVYVPDGEY